MKSLLHRLACSSVAHRHFHHQSRPSRLSSTTSFAQTSIASRNSFARCASNGEKIQSTVTYPLIKCCIHSGTTCLDAAKLLTLVYSSWNHDNELSGSTVQRHKPWQMFNRYRPVDPPTPQNKEAVAVKDTEMTAALPSSSQKEILKYRPQYSIIVHTPKREHRPPESMKQYAWKPWEKPPESPSGHNIDVPQQKNTNNKNSSSNKYNEKKDNCNGSKDKNKGEPAKPVEDMDKKGLMRA
ncbi:hypothetical protein BC939DRAFT_454871, partial [Gamsiella multidivaricata]|uniref:uncharacterized protein n=1 Tax=Gamsiella multidivaricata TaxID=101098 RepID=UPI00221E6F16